MQPQWITKHIPSAVWCCVLTRGRGGKSTTARRSSSICPPSPRHFTQHHTRARATLAWLGTYSCHSCHSCHFSYALGTYGTLQPSLVCLVQLGLELIFPKLRAPPCAFHSSHLISFFFGSNLSGTAIGLVKCQLDLPAARFLSPSRFNQPLFSWGTNKPAAHRHWCFTRPSHPFPDGRRPFRPAVYLQNTAPAVENPARAAEYGNPSFHSLSIHPLGAVSAFHWGPTPIVSSAWSIVQARRVSQIDSRVSNHEIHILGESLVRKKITLFPSYTFVVCLE